MVAPVLDWTSMGVASGKYHPVSGIPTQLGVLHSAECPLQIGFARSLTTWAAVPLSQGGPEAGWQRFVDPSVRLRFIPDELAAWHASEANPLSIGWEQAGYARFTRAEWTTPLGLVQLDNLAYDMAEVGIRDGLDARWLSTAEVRAVLDQGNRSIKGFCTHRQIDPESRTDPGDGYPYDLLMTRIRYYMNPVKDWFEMATEAQLRKIIREEIKAANPWAYRNPDLERDDAYALLRAARTYSVQGVKQLDELTEKVTAALEAGKVAGQ